MKRKTSLETLLAFGIGWVVFMLGVGIAIVVGWIMNLFHVIGMTDPLSTGEGIARIIGIPVVPLGGILGLFF